MGERCLQLQLVVRQPSRKAQRNVTVHVRNINSFSNIAIQKTLRQTGNSYVQSATPDQSCNDIMLLCRTWRRSNWSINNWYQLNDVYSTSVVLNAVYVKPETVPIDCMDILVRCCQADDCPLLRQIKDLFQCVEVLEKSPETPPFCTRTCRSLVSEVLSTEYGSDLLSCNCSRVEQANVPKISNLCQPFQSHALVKCGVTNPSPSGKACNSRSCVKHLVIYV